MSSSDLRHPAGGDVGKGLLAGFVGGLAGTWAMAAFEALWTRTLPAADPRRAARLRRAGVGAAWHAQSEPRSHEQPISPSERLVDAAARKALGRPPTPAGREVGGSIVHYAFSAVTAAV